MQLVREVRIVSASATPNAHIGTTEAQYEALRHAITQFMDKQETELRSVLSELQRDFHCPITLAVQV